MPQDIASSIDSFARSIQGVLADSGSLAKIERRQATAEALRYGAPQAGLAEARLRPQSMRNASGAPSNTDEALADIVTMFSRMPSGGGQQVAPPDWGSIYANRAQRQQETYNQEDKAELARVETINQKMIDDQKQRANIGEQAIKAMQEESGLQAKYREQDIVQGANIQKAVEERAARGDNNSAMASAKVNALVPEHERAGAYSYIVTQAQANDGWGDGAPMDPVKFGQYLEEYRTRSLREAPLGDPNRPSPSSSAIDDIENNMPPPASGGDDRGDYEESDLPVFDDTLDGIAASNRARVAAGGWSASPGELMQQEKNERERGLEQRQIEAHEATMSNRTEDKATAAEKTAYDRTLDKIASGIDAEKTAYGRNKDTVAADRQRGIDAF